MESTCHFVCGIHSETMRRIGVLPTAGTSDVCRWLFPPMCNMNCLAKCSVEEDARETRIGPADRKLDNCLSVADANYHEILMLPPPKNWMTFAVRSTGSAGVRRQWRLRLSISYSPSPSLGCCFVASWLVELLIRQLMALCYSPASSSTNWPIKTSFPSNCFTRHRDWLI